MSLVVWMNGHFLSCMYELVSALVNWGLEETLKRSTRTWLPHAFLCCSVQSILWPVKGLHTKLVLIEAEAKQQNSARKQLASLGLNTVCWHCFILEDEFDANGEYLDGSGDSNSSQGWCCAKRPMHGCLFVCVFVICAGSFWFAMAKNQQWGCACVDFPLYLTFFDQKSFCCQSKCS